MSWEGQYVATSTVELTARFVDGGAPVLGGAATITIWYPGDAFGAPTISAVAMPEWAQGVYRYVTAALAGVGVYKVICQIVASNLYCGGTFEIIDDRIGDILADTAAIEPLVTANLDVAISTVIAAIVALNDLSIADVQTAMTNQGYTAVRAILLDNLDAAISTVITIVTDIDNDLGEPGDAVATGTVHGKLGSVAEFVGHDSIKQEIIDLVTAVTVRRIQGL